MAAIITNNFRIHNAEQFYESFNEAATTNYYLFIGRPQPFTTTTGGGTDSAPPTPADNQVSETGHWRSLRVRPRRAEGVMELGQDARELRRAGQGHDSWARWPHGLPA